MLLIGLTGPSGAGKSTMADRLGKEFGFLHVDTGAMYRTLAYKAIKNNICISPDNSELEKMLSETNLDIRHCEDGQHMFADGEDVTAYIRTPEISMGASKISAIPFAT